MKRRTKDIYHISLIKGVIISLLWLIAPAVGVYAQSDFTLTDSRTETEASDTTQKLRYPIKKAQAQTYQDLNKKTPIDFEEGADYTTTVEYDPESGTYVIHRKVGDMDIATPFAMSEREYADYSLSKSMDSYWAEKNKEGGNGGNKFSLNEIQIGLGQAGDQIFGPGGIKFKLQGSVELKFGLSIVRRDNPSISERNRRSTNFDFDPKIQLATSATVGDRVKFSLNYNTEASFDADQELVKLSYEGKEDDIIRKIEVGDVSLPLASTLIPGSTSLFGVLTELQYGKLHVSAVVSQQESEGKTISTKNGCQTTEYELSALEYDENRHYFISEYFYQNFDRWMRSAPVITSGIVINKIEVWVTNRSTSASTTTRNILAFRDLGEGNNPLTEIPHNKANSLYSVITAADNVALRDYTTAPEHLRGGNVLLNGSVVDEDAFEVINQARLLTKSEYEFNPELGFISLRTALNNDEVLAVAFEYTYKGKTYTVGEMTTADVSQSSSRTNTENTITTSPPLFVKLLKKPLIDPANERLWKLMMKNVYNIDGYNVQEEKFKLDVRYNYQNDSISSYLTYIPEDNLKNIPLIKVLGLDRLNSKQHASPDGKFDFLEGYTVLAAQGRVIFPMVEPFGKGLASKFSDGKLAEKYTFPELYAYTKTDAEAYANKNKFIIAGEYKSSSGSEIKLNSTKVARGSVKVTAGGRTLEENVGYTVDYNMGVVRILDEAVLASNAQVNVSLESESMFSSQRKSLIGTNLEYAFTDKFSVGGTIMRLSEKPMTDKVANGTEPINNTIWGINGSYTTQSNWLTKITDMIPLINATAPSNFSVSGEFAQLIPGHGAGIEDENGNSVAYIDDFEGSESSINLISATAWTIASVPFRHVRTAATGLGGQNFIRPVDPIWKNPYIVSGLERAHFAWYHVDNIFQERKSLTPKSISGDEMYNHLTRLVTTKEIYQNRQPYYGESQNITTLNLAYYPTERGIYNVDLSDIDRATGRLLHPEDRWGGIMRKLETTNFDRSNVEYLEFWMMDPYVEEERGFNTNASGQLVFNLGEISEDILKDDKIECEQTISPNDNYNEQTIWGRRGIIQSVVVAFDDENIKSQDKGLDGLSSDEERAHETFGRYYQAMKNLGVSNEYVDRILADPAGDDFHHYRGNDYDAAKVSILDRYKYYNGMENNSIRTNNSNSGTSAIYPNTEDINGDRTLNTNESYFEYVIEINKEVFEDVVNWNKNYIVNKVSYTPEIDGKKLSPVNWYQFRIPVRDTTAYTRQGKISSFNSIRFMRMYMTGFADETFLRFGALEFTKTDWRVYKNNERLFVDGEGRNNPSAIQISSVDIEEDNMKKPVGYCLPPGIDQSPDPSQEQIRLQNEKSMLLSINRLGSKETAGVYKTTSLDTRQYKRFKMFVHAESHMDETEVPDNTLCVFVRLGSDFTNNYYEYRIPLKITEPGANVDTEVWPLQNEFDFAFEQLTDLKLRRNKKKVAGEISYTKPYSEMDGDNVMTVMGNPTFGDITSMMIGIRNEHEENTYSADIWVDEMRLSGFNEDGGWAAIAEVGLTLSDFASFDATGRIETTGFGSIEANVMDRNMEDTYSIDLSTTMQLGKFFPDKARVNMPLSITYSAEKEKPKYDPIDNDVLLDDALHTYTNDSVKKEIEDRSLTTSKFTSYALTNVRVGIISKKKPMPYDPANFSFSVAYNKREEKDPDIEYDRTTNINGRLNYSYSLSPKAVEPFKKVKFLKSPKLKLIKDFNFYFLPTSLSFSTSMDRYYNEVQTRDYTQPLVRDTSFNYLSWDKNWTWDRTADIKWNLSKSLKMTFTTSMNSTIDEVIRTDEGTYRDIPGRWYLDKIDSDNWYELWKDTVWSCIKDFGTPYTYSQRLSVNYNLPINKLPYLDWITGNAGYTADYNWQRGVELEINNRFASAGNIAASRRSWNGDARMNFETLYNKSSYLKEVNKKYNSRKPLDKKVDKKAEKKDKEAADTADAKEEKKAPAVKTYERKSIRLKKGAKTRISHRLNNTRVSIAATDKDGKPYPIKFEVIDANAINIVPKEDASGINIVVTAKERKENNALDLASRILMFIRNVSANYRQTYDLTLNGYLRGSGFLGQAKYQDHFAPGGGFTFGFFDHNDFIEKCAENGWLLDSTYSVSSPITITENKDFQAKASLEPYPGIKIDVTSAWSRSMSKEDYYMYADADNQFSGSANRSDIAILTAFRRPSLDSETFNDFLAYIRHYQGEVTRDYWDNYSTEDDGKLEHALGFTDKSADVLIPAFLAAYTGRGSERTKLGIVPKQWAMLPNWKVSVDLLNRAPGMKKAFKTFNITHGYKCTYNVNSYENFNGWTPFYEGSKYGYVANSDGSLGYSAGHYSLGSVNFAESFNPLIGINASMKNSVRAKVEYKRSRNMSLDVPALQVVESYSNELVIGGGYRINDFGGMIGIGSKQKKVSNDLNINCDISCKKTDAYIRKIVEQYSERSSGLNSVLIQFTAEYVFSEKINIKFYYDRSSSNPKVSTSYPTVNSDFGVSLKFQLSN